MFLITLVHVINNNYVLFFKSKHFVMILSLMEISKLPRYSTEDTKVFLLEFPLSPHIKTNASND